MPAYPEPTPVTLLTGFLGSGKTTLLNHLLSDPEFTDTAVIVNEFGEIGIDHHLLARSSDDIVLLNAGCVCCTVRGDLLTTLDSLYERRSLGEVGQFRRVVIETTGLADTAPILQLLLSDSVSSVRYRLTSVVTVVDGVNGFDTLTQHPQAVVQVTAAERIVITKADLADEQAVATLTEHLQAINPGASVRVNSQSTSDNDLAKWLAAPVQNEGTEIARWQAVAGSDGHDHHWNGIGTFTIVRDCPMEWAAFQLWAGMLAALCGPDLLRIKGFVNIAGRDAGPVAVHAVQQVFHPPEPCDYWPSSDRRTRLVFITRNIGRALIEQTLDVWEPSLA